MDVNVLKTDARREVVIEDKTLRICPKCSEDYGRWAVAGECDCGCGEYFKAGEKVICCEGRHFSVDCFEYMKTTGEVEEAPRAAQGKNGEI